MIVGRAPEYGVRGRRIRQGNVVDRVGRSGHFCRECDLGITRSGPHTNRHEADRHTAARGNDDGEIASGIPCHAVDRSVESVGVVLRDYESGDQRNEADHNGDRNKGATGLLVGGVSNLAATAVFALRAWH